MAAGLFSLYTLPRFTSGKEVVTACVYCKITGRRYKQNFREFSGNVDNVPRNMPLILGGAQGSGGTVSSDLSKITGDDQSQGACDARRV